MSYIKLIDNGHVLEIYEMEKAPINPNDLKYNLEGDTYNPHDWINYYKHWLDIYNFRAECAERAQDREKRKELRRLQTIRDSKADLKRLAVRNFTSNDLFLTLTYNKANDDITKGDKDFREFIDTLREEIGQKFKYIAVREIETRKSGKEIGKQSVHYHFVTDLDIEWNDRIELHIWERDLGKVWGHGWVDVERMDKHKSKKKQFENKPVDNVGAYMAKYFSKSADDPRLEGKKMFLCSQGLERPKIYTQKDAIERIKELGIRQKKMTFGNCYDSEYQGHIKYQEYNLMRQEEN